MTFTGQTSAVLGWFVFAEIPPPGDGADGRVDYNGYFGGVRPAPSVTLRIHIG